MILLQMKESASYNSGSEPFLGHGLVQCHGLAEVSVWLFFFFFSFQFPSTFDVKVYTSSSSVKYLQQIAYKFFYAT